MVLLILWQAVMDLGLELSQIPKFPRICIEKQNLAIEFSILPKTIGAYLSLVINHGFFSEPTHPATESSILLKTIRAHWSKRWVVDQETTHPATKTSFLLKTVRAYWSKRWVINHGLISEPTHPKQSPASSWRRSGHTNRNVGLSTTGSFQKQLKEIYTWCSRTPHLTILPPWKVSNPTLVRFLFRCHPVAVLVYLSSRWFHQTLPNSG